MLWIWTLPFNTSKYYVSYNILHCTFITSFYYIKLNLSTKDYTMTKLRTNIISLIKTWSLTFVQQYKHNNLTRWMKGYKYTQGQQVFFLMKIYTVTHLSKPQIPMTNNVAIKLGENVKIKIPFSLPHIAYDFTWWSCD